MKTARIAMAASGLVALAGCQMSTPTTEYKTNTASLKPNAFTSDSITYSYDAVRASTGTYLFSEIPEGMTVKDLDGNEIGRSEYFPFYAVRKNEMLEVIDEIDHESIVQSATGKVRIFVYDRDNNGLSTSRTFESPELEEGVFVGEIGKTKFDMPTVIDFGRDGLRAIPYATIKNTDGEKLQVLVRNPTYVPNHQTGFLEIRGQLFEETLGTVTTPITPVNADDKDTSISELLIEAEKFNSAQNSNPD